MKNRGASKNCPGDVKEFGRDYGLIHEAVVMGRKAGADQNFWAALAHNEELFRNVVELVCQINENTFLLPISFGWFSPVISPTDGEETLAEGKDVFCQIDSDFEKYGTNKKGPAAEAIAVCGFEVIKDATLPQIFGSLSSSPNKCCFINQTQIKCFARDYSQYLRPNGYANFFLFEVDKKFSIANIHKYSNKVLEAIWLPYDGKIVVSPINHPRVFVPLVRT